MKIHFIGIGGIGISALAKYYLEKRHHVTGSDLLDTETTQALTRKGAKISIGPHHAENIPFEIDMIIYSPAVQRTNPELQHAKVMRNRASSTARIDLKPRAASAGKIEILSYPELVEGSSSFILVPMIIVGSNSAKSRIFASIAVVVLLPWVPETAMV